ncbi:ABC transporter ATP-binding protein [Rickettsiales endosymbiont of Stachyamoeba lipophora]|uniref:ABC transporter ATP-binding protein n=1 Tax=Rickettsiales endosymbiont of Stachyamoeba lipophora TaxID=2486578 RepID=UPI000F649ED0|nr:ABC transporter ATP-binding protein [Rickettsiales endosymbiont of Stachyamoeba lipophora]AZL15403.1 ABC transporter ATP-binding protein [Rickettsiales endosymbiont of Stachyamoeba lipophora]
MTETILELNNITKSFTQGGHHLDILKDISLTIEANQVIGLLGPSGCGKTSLLNICGLVDEASHGEVRINHLLVKKMKDAERAKIRGKNVGFVYQFHHLLPDFTALENVMMPALVNKLLTKEEAIKVATSLLESLGLAERIQHFPAQLSGGEQQRVAIARAMINKPKLILADEPTGNLDPQTAAKVFALMIETIKSNNLAALIVTHNHQLIKNFDKVLTLEKGRLVRYVEANA